MGIDGLHSGDCVEVMRAWPDACVDAVVCDPPYGLEFMGKEWDKLQLSDNESGPQSEGWHDNGGKNPYARRATARYAGKKLGAKTSEMQTQQAWHEAWAREAFRVLKPGGHLVAFGGSRTYHRLACALEDAGFEIRDSLMWLYGSGFPKSLNLDGEREGWGTALKPAHEPCVLARKPLEGTVAANVQKWGTGALNIDGCRVNARWPANVVLDEEAGAMLGEPSRFFYCPKVSRKERDLGCEDLDHHDAQGTTNRKPGAPGTVNPRAGAGHNAGGPILRCKHCEVDGSGGRRVSVCKVTQEKHTEEDWVQVGVHPRVRNNHPTVKPIALMAWLIRLVTPPGGVVLDPFMGSGSTGIAALREGARFVGIEREPEYFRIATARIEAAQRDTHSQSV